MALKRFDPQAIHERKIARLRPKVEWAMLVDDGTIGAVLSAEDEAEAEIARYGENLYKESKWKAAANMTSLTHMGGLISRKPARAKSATGFITVSHTDNNGTRRLPNLGKYFFSVDSESNWDDLEEDAATGTKAKALVPWLSTSLYHVSKGTRFITNTGIEYIATQTVQIKPLLEAWSVISNNEDKLTAFYEAGGWDSIKYLRVPVIQGKIQTADFGKAKGTRFETFMINSAKVEDASNSVSENYLQFKVTLADGSTEVWTQISNIALAGAFDKVYEAIPNADNTAVTFKVGDGVTGMTLTEGSTVQIQYLETEGASGNVEAKYQVTSIIFPSGETMTDPRTNEASDFLSCTNTLPLTGGQDAENDETYREQAPLSYLKNYSTTTIDAYTAWIRANSPVKLTHLKLYPSTQEISLSTSRADAISAILASRSVIKIVATNSVGDEIDSPDTAFLKPLKLAMGTHKSSRDSFEYEAPNMVGIIASCKIIPNDYSVTASEISSIAEAYVEQNHSKTNVAIAQSMHLSSLIHEVQTLPTTHHTTIDLWAEADVKTDYDSIALYTATDNTEYVEIPFEFPDAVISTKGFKTSVNGRIDPLHVNINFKNAPTKEATLSRTLLLLDHRQDYTKYLSDTLMDDYIITPDGSSTPAIATIRGTRFGVNGTIRISDMTGSYNNRIVRLASFPSLKNSVFDDAKVAAVLSFASSPTEYLPYITQSDGTYKLYTSGVTSSLQVKPFEGATAFYKKNTSFASMEVYWNPVDNYKTGALYIPVSYFGWTSELYDKEGQARKTALADLFKSFVNFEVIAQPMQTSITPANENDLIYLDRIDIDVDAPASAQ